MDEELEHDDESEWVELEPERWSWSAFAAAGMNFAAACTRDFADFLDEAKIQFAAMYLRTRDEQKKADVKADCQQMLAALDDL